MSKTGYSLVKNARTESGVTQAALAKKVKGLTASDISKIERGEKEPDKETLKELAKALGVTQTSFGLEQSQRREWVKTTANSNRKNLPERVHQNQHQKKPSAPAISS